MKSILIKTKPSYSVDISSGGIEGLGQEVKAVLSCAKVMVITDSTVDKLYGDTLVKELSGVGYMVYKFVLAAGEENKTLANYCKIIDALAVAGLTRKDAIIALGGGVVGDISGFAASTYMRGIDFVQVPTTLLACVDSSVGGKTAVDLSQGKNLVGAFYQPKKVLIRTALLDTLTQDNIQDGMGEVLKYAVLRGGDLLEELTAGKQLNMENIIAQCVDIKREYVESDERDTGIRQMLNLGHTFGHAHEHMNNFSVSHGKSVALGLRYALEISRRVGVLERDGAVKNLLDSYGVAAMQQSIGDLAQCMKLDKKNFNGKINFVLIKKIGECILYPMTIDELLALSDKREIFNYSASGTLKCINSKSYCHRAIIMAARAATKTTIHGVPMSADTLATIGALEKLGASVQWISDSSIIVSPITQCSDNASINVKESGSTMRFILPQVAALGVTAKVFAEGRLPERTNAPLIQALTEHGINIVANQPICMSGKLMSGKYSIAGNISSQYISGLLMALSTLENDSEIYLTTALESSDYVEITLDVMRQFGVQVTVAGNSYSIKGGQTIHAKSDIIIEADWSNACPWLVIGATCGGITIEGLNLDSKQGDRTILDILKEMGAKFIVQDNKITAQKSALTAITVSVKDCPDIVPALAVACAAASGISRIKDVDRLRIKESDRIASTVASLNAIGIKAEYDGDIVIHGGNIVSGIIDSHNDHRIAMLAAIAGCISMNGVTLLGARAISKSYPDFFEKLISIGGRVNAW